jgi:hypothetical protein
MRSGHQTMWEAPGQEAPVSPAPSLTKPRIQARVWLFRRWGRTGFDLIDTPEAACRGRFVGLVNHRTKKQLTITN